MSNNKTTMKRSKSTGHFRPISSPITTNVASRPASCPPCVQQSLTKKPLGPMYGPSYVSRINGKFQPKPKGGKRTRRRNKRRKTKRRKSRRRR